jgi:lysozyme
MVNADFIKQAQDLLIKHEGIRLARYKCTAGKDTIGVGRNLEDKGLSAEEARIIGSTYPTNITMEEAMMLLCNDILEFTGELDSHIPWFPMSFIIVKLVLLDMAFNLGIKGLLAFKMTLKAIEEERYDEAVDAMLDSKWARQVPNRSRDLADMLLSIKKRRA